MNLANICLFLPAESVALSTIFELSKVRVIFCVALKSFAVAVLAVCPAVPPGNVTVGASSEVSLSST